MRSVVCHKNERTVLSMPAMPIDAVPTVVRAHVRPDGSPDQHNGIVWLHDPHHTETVPDGVAIGVRSAFVPFRYLQQQINSVLLKQIVERSVFAR